MSYNVALSVLIQTCLPNLILRSFIIPLAAGNQRLILRLVSKAAEFRAEKVAVAYFRQCRLMLRGRSHPVRTVNAPSAEKKRTVPHQGCPRFINALCVWFFFIPFNYSQKAHLVSPSTEQKANPIRGCCSKLQLIIWTYGMLCLPVSC